MIFRGSQQWLRIDYWLPKSDNRHWLPKVKSCLTSKTENFKNWQLAANFGKGYWQPNLLIPQNWQLAVDKDQVCILWLARINCATVFLQSESQITTTALPCLISLLKRPTSLGHDEWHHKYATKAACAIKPMWYSNSRHAETRTHHRTGAY